MSRTKAINELKNLIVVAPEHLRAPLRDRTLITQLKVEAAFASLAGVTPLETSSEQCPRHRLNRGGDRALNHALHTVAVTQMRYHPKTQAYNTRRSSEDKTHRDIRRSVKPALPRRLYRTIEATARTHDPSNAA